MGVFEIQAPDGKVYEVEAPDMQTAAAAFKPKQKQELPDLPSVYSQYANDLENPMGMAATLGASDAQLGDIVKKQLGDRFIRMEPAGDYMVAVTRGPDGKEQRGYVNKPGLDTEDVTRSIRGALPYFLSGGLAGAGVKAAGGGLLAMAGAEGAANAATSAAGDLAQIQLGSQQGIEKQKAAVSGALGVGIPLASRAVGNAARSVREYLTPQTGPLQDMSRKAVNNVAEGISSNPINTHQNVKGVLNTYGPETMIADLGDTLQADAAALARTPVAKDVAAPAIRGRTEMAPQRIKSTLNFEMGQERNLPQYIEQGSARYNAQARPLYQQFEGTAIKPTPELANILDAAKASGAYDRALKKLQVKRLDPNLPQNNGKFLDLIKRELDGLASAAKTSGNRTDYADYTALAKALRDEVDRIISPQNPASSSWAQARSIAGEGLEGRDAAELGSQMFGTNPKDPHLVQTELAGMTQYGKDMYKEGGRNKLRQVMGRAASNYGPKGDAAARRALNSEFSRENLQQAVGNRPAQRIADRIDAENQYAKLHDMALGNSVTDTMQAARKRWAPHTESQFASEAGKKGPTGLVTEYGLKLADALMLGQMKKAELRTAVDGAKILTATGKQRDDLVDALFQLMQDKKQGVVTGKKFEALARGLLESYRAPQMQQQR